MKFQLVLAITVLLHLIEAEAGHSKTPGDGGNINLVYLGMVDGKGYFADQTYRDWFSSKAFCEEQGMKLATIKTNREVEFIIASYNSTTFTGYHWIAARDARSKRALVWDDLGTEPEDLDGIYWGYGPAIYQLCGAYASSSENHHIDILNCDGSDYFLSTLCEI